MNDLKRQFERELVALQESGAGLPFTLDPAGAWMLLANLQLALRHPGNNGASASWAREFASNIESRLCAGRPAMSEVARRGWLPKHDI